MEKELIIDGIRISDDNDYYVIAEIGHNHQGSLENCKKLFNAAKDAGASAVKLQKRDNKCLFTKIFYDQPYGSQNAYGSTYGLHREKLEFNRDQYVELIKHAKKIGITFFSTAFDIPSANFLAELNMPAFKIASGDIRNIPLLRHVAAFNRPIILSTGGASLANVKQGIKEILKINTKLAVLQCTAAYPPKDEELNLKVIRTYKENFPNLVIGYSGHDIGVNMSLAAATLGARIIEKHFTLDHSLKGTDHAISLEPKELKLLVKELKRLKESLGDGLKVIQEVEKSAIYKMGKKIVASRNLPKGHILSLLDVTIKSPGDGISPDHLSDILGKKLVSSVKEDDNIIFENLAMGLPAA